MEKFVHLTSVAAPLMRVNIDTDVIIPSKEIKGVSKTGLSGGMFANWRYSDPVKRVENPDFVLNREPTKHAHILVAGANFGCGSSREHAVWAMAEYGFRAVIAPSFGAIYYSNCIRNGILPVRLPDDQVNALAAWVEADPAKNQITIDLPGQIVTGPPDARYIFEIAPGDKEMLLEGLDPIGVTLKREPQIAAFEAKDRATRPWVYIS